MGKQISYMYERMYVHLCMYVCVHVYLRVLHMFLSSVCDDTVHVPRIDFLSFLG